MTIPKQQVYKPRGALSQPDDLDKLKEIKNFPYRANR